MVKIYYIFPHLYYIFYILISQIFSHYVYLSTCQRNSKMHTVSYCQMKKWLKLNYKKYNINVIFMILFLYQYWIGHFFSGFEILMISTPIRSFPFITFLRIRIPYIKFVPKINFVSLHITVLFVQSCDRVQSHVLWCWSRDDDDDVMEGTLKDSTSGLNNVVYNKCGWLQSVCYYIKASFSW